MPTIHQRDLKALKIREEEEEEEEEEEGDEGEEEWWRRRGRGEKEYRGKEEWRRSGGEGEVEEEEEKEEEWRRRGRKRRSGEARTHSRTAAANRVYFKIRHRSTYRSVVLFVYMNQYKHIWIVCI